MSNKNHEITFDRDLSPIIGKEENIKETKDKNLNDNNNTQNKNVIKLEHLNSLEFDVKNSRNQNNKNQNYENLEKQNKLNQTQEKILYEEIGVNVNFIPDIIKNEKIKLENDYNKKEENIKNKIEENFINEKNELMDLINNLKLEIKSKDENLIKISHLNEILRKKLSEISDKIKVLYNEKVNNKKIIKKLNEDNNNNKEKYSLEEELKKKEIQLKTTQNILNAVNKENKSLKEKLDFYNEDEGIIKLLDNLQLKTEENNKLIQEIKDLKFQIEEHKKCKKQFENNKKEINDLTHKLIKFKEKYVQLKLENNINQNLKEKENKKIKTNIDENKNSNIINSPKKILIRKNLEISKFEIKKKLNPSNSSPDIKSKRNFELNNNFSLFSDNEKKAISTLFNNKEELDSFNKKITIIESYRSSNENAFKNKIKKLTNELSEKEEIIQYLTSKSKENELKLMLSLNQINGTDRANKILKRKINEQKEVINYLQSDKNKKENKDFNELKSEFNLTNRKSELNIMKKVNLKIKEIEKLKKDLNISDIDNNIKYNRNSFNHISNSLIPPLINQYKDDTPKNKIKKDNSNKHQIIIKQVKK